MEYFYQSSIHNATLQSGIRPFCTEHNVEPNHPILLINELKKCPFQFNFSYTFILPCVVVSPSEPNKFTTPASTLIPGIMQRFLSTSTNGTPSSVFW